MIQVYDNFLTEAECTHLIGKAAGRLSRSTGFDLETGESKNTDIRTSSGMFFERRETPIIEDVEMKLAYITGSPTQNGEGLQILKYAVGQEYRPHHDYFDPAFPGTEEVLRRGGQRIKTVIIYLNTVKEGGETIFPLLGKKVLPKRGAALMFDNVLPNGELDESSFHGGMPVLQGTKWVATKWIREREFI